MPELSCHVGGGWDKILRVLESTGFGEAQYFPRLGKSFPIAILQKGFGTVHHGGRMMLMKVLRQRGSGSPSAFPFLKKGIKLSCYGNCCVDAEFLW